ncbi:MAG: hypothetical protein IJO34_00385 [Akkermansia sp.]|nr:hypothetical protein [Akkermansia sp.]
MKKNLMKGRLGGFTLMETLLAVALVGLLVSIFLTVFVPARGMVQQALTKQESERITGILRAELATLHPHEQANAGDKRSSANKYLSTFDKGFYWLLKSKRPSSSIVIFSYRADTAKPPRQDGSYPPVPANRAVPGKNSQLVTVACPMNDPIHKNDIKDAVGPVFIAKMTQLLPAKNGEYELAGQPGVIKGASSPENYFSERENDSWGGAIFYRADFYLMSPPNPARYRSRSWAKMGRPLFSSNLSFRR